MIWFAYYPFALSFFVAFLVISLIFKKKGITLSKNKGIILELVCLGVGFLVRGYTQKGLSRAFVAFVIALFYFNMDDSTTAMTTYLVAIGIFVVYSAYRTTTFDPNAPKKRSHSSSSSSDDDFDVRSFMEHHHHSDDDHRSPF